MHGKQDCGTTATDYISAYKTFLDQNENSDKPEYIDVFLEVGNYNVDVKESNAKWINVLRTEFRDCYLYFKNCRYEYTRFHWSDPVWHKDSWLTKINHVPNYMPDDWKKKFPTIADNITSENDLLKIIFDDPNIIKEGERCSIGGGVWGDNWKDFVTKQHRMMLIRESEESHNKGLEWWRRSIYHTGRFKMDIFALLRMFRKNDSKGRFKNIIYHAGDWHTQNLALMLKFLSYEQLYDKYDDKQCMEINLTDEFKMREQPAQPAAPALAAAPAPAPAAAPAAAAAQRPFGPDNKPPPPQQPPPPRQPPSPSKKPIILDAEGAAQAAVALVEAEAAKAEAAKANKKSGFISGFLNFLNLSQPPEAAAQEPSEAAAPPATTPAAEAQDPLKNLMATIEDFKSRKIQIDNEIKRIKKQISEQRKISVSTDPTSKSQLENSIEQHKVQLGKLKFHQKKLDDSINQQVESVKTILKMRNAVALAKKYKKRGGSKKKTKKNKNKTKKNKNKRKKNKTKKKNIKKRKSYVKKCKTYKK